MTLGLTTSQREGMMNNIWIAAIRGYYQQKDAIQRIKTLHSRDVYYGGIFCKHCSELSEGSGQYLVNDEIAYPCPTIQALDGLNE